MALSLNDDFLPRTATPRCPYFGECGGCALQDVPYANQLRAKQEAIKQHLGRDIPITPSPDPYGYRHRMDYVTSFGKLGLRKKGDGKTVVDLRECHIVPERISKLMPDIHMWIEDLSIPMWNLVTQRGKGIRFVTFRHAVSTDHLMVILVTSSREVDVTELARRLAHHVESVVWSVQERVGDDSHGEVVRVWGRETLKQRIGEYTFEISPGSFSQNNLQLVDTLYDAAAMHVSGLTLDLYCGTGTIGIHASKRASQVIGVDTSEPNIELAKRALEANGVENVEFVLDNANHFLAFYDGPTPDTVIVDPPRSGLAPKLIRKLNRLGAPTIVYVSCNPKTYAADLEQFEGYELVEAEAFDMFPQTPHVELVTRLQRVDSTGV